MDRRSCRRMATTVTAMICLVIPLAACSSGGGIGGRSTADTTVSATADPRGELMLPIDAYALSTPDVRRMGRARMLLAGDCMRRFGFAFDPAGVGADETEARVKDVGLYGNRRRYGVTDEAVAETYGYHLASTVSGQASPAAEPRSDHGLGEVTAAKEAVLFGRTADGKALAEVGGHRIPEGGCLGEAESRIAKVGKLSEAAVVSRIAGESFHRSLADPEVTAAIGRWSACMKAKGYTFPGPLEAAGSFDLDTSVVPVKEIATAEADVRCKREVHLVDVWMAFEVRYQKSEIEKHAEELQMIKKVRDEQMKSITQILAAGS